jgi:hypothetical protein
VAKLFNSVNNLDATDMTYGRFRLRHPSIPQQTSGIAVLSLCRTRVA